MYCIVCKTCINKTFLCVRNLVVIFDAETNKPKFIEKTVNLSDTGEDVEKSDTC